jgi:hypothetical protein
MLAECASLKLGFPSILSLLKQDEKNLEPMPRHLGDNQTLFISMEFLQNTS